MSCCDTESDASALLRLPRELRDEIFAYVLLGQEEISLKRCARLQPTHGEVWTVLDPRYQTQIAEDGSSCEFTAIARDKSTPAPLGQVNRQLRIEVSEFLEHSGLPVVARVRNFDFEHVLHFLVTPDSKPRFLGYTVGEDGEVQSNRPMLELVGPYDEDWRANLERWVKGLERLFPQRHGELAFSHKTLPWNGHWGIRTPPEIVREAWQLQQAWPLGVGGRELELVFFAMFTRQRMEEMMGWHTPILDRPEWRESRPRRVGWKES